MKINKIIFLNFRYFLGIYLFIIAFASLSDILNGTKGEDLTYSKKILQAFSLKQNWIRLKTIKSTPEVKRLRVIQGIRFYNMILVILTHTIMYTFMLPVSNTDMTESVSINIYYLLSSTNYSDC